MTDPREGLEQDLIEAATKTEPTEHTPDELANQYIGARDMSAGASSTLRKTARALLIAAGLKSKPGDKARRRAALRANALQRMFGERRHTPTVPRITRLLTEATFTLRNGKQVKRPYVLVVDRSRYTPEKLREIRRTRG